MRIAIVTNAIGRGDGQGRVNYEIARAALQRGHEAVLVSRTAAPDLVDHPRVTWIEIPIPYLPAQLLRNIVFAVRSTRWLRTNRPTLDVVLANGTITWMPADINVAHFVHSVWLHSDVHTSRQSASWITALYQWTYTAVNAVLERLSYRQANQVVAVSDKIRRELIEIGVAPDRVMTIVNGVDLEEFHPYPVRRADREVLGLPPDVPLAFFAGDIKTSRKNLDTVLKALADTPGLHLAVAGSLPGSPFPDLAERLGVTDRTHFLGFRDDVAALMQAVDFFVFPSRYEACTLVLLEALATGLPVISARTTGGVEIVDDEAGFILEDPDCIPSLAKHMQTLAADGTLRQKMGVAARNVAERHSWRHMTNHYVALFENARPLFSPPPESNPTASLNAGLQDQSHLHC